MISFSNLHLQGSPILPDLDGWIFLLEAENKSTLSWMSRLSRMREFHIMNLCHFFLHIVLYFNAMFPSRFYGQHIAVILNVEADTLSCPQYHPTYNKIFQR